MAGFFVAVERRKSTAARIIGGPRIAVSIGRIGAVDGRLIVNRPGRGIVGRLVNHRGIAGLLVINDRTGIISGRTVSSSEADVDPGSRLGGRSGEEAQGEHGQESQGKRFKVFHMEGMTVEFVFGFRNF